MAPARGLTLATILLFAAFGSSIAAPVQTAKPELLIVGSPHFGNPARDIANIHIEDVTTPKRQREIEVIVKRLAAFHPTVVAVEWPAEKQAKLDRRYADYQAGRYKLAPDEVDQLGLRLAAFVGLKRVHAIDWLGEPPGKDSDYDFPAWAKANGRGSDWQNLQKRSQAQADELSKLMACTPVSTWLRRLNAPAYRRADQSEYFEIATFGGTKTNPGANWSRRLVRPQFAHSR